MFIEQGKFQILGDCEIEIPDYMTSLQNEELEEIKVLKLTSAIIACGMHPKTKVLTLLTSTGKLYEIDTFDFLKTDDPGDNAFPIEMGQQIIFISENKVVYVDSLDVISASVEIQTADFSIDIANENKALSLT
jgi:hypothetical protein